MTEKKLKKTLEKQLQLLSQCSEARKDFDMSLYYLTEVMVSVYDRLLAVSDDRQEDKTHSDL